MLFLQDGTLEVGGKYNEDALQIEPTVLTNITWQDTVMEDEIFGPILPLMEYNKIEDVITTVQQHPKPLALYVFSENKEIQKQVIRNISYGEAVSMMLCIILLRHIYPLAGWEIVG